MPNNKTCLLCGNSCSHFAKAHIIPWGLMKRTPCASEMSLAAKNEWPRFLPKGVYDEHIVCDKCEHEILTPLDQYAIRIYRDFENARVIGMNMDGRPFSCLVFNGVDRGKLRAFFASILWRCSVSKYIACRDIDVGDTYRTRICNDLLSNGNFEYIDSIGYSILPDGDDFIADGIRDGFVLPQKIRLSFDNRQANGYMVELPRLHFKVSLDRRIHPFSQLDASIPCLGTEFKDIAFSLSSTCNEKKLALLQLPQSHDRVTEFSSVCKQVVGNFRKPKQCQNYIGSKAEGMV